MTQRHGYGAIVLAGGKSARLGRDKASEVVAGKPLLQHVIDRVTEFADEIIIVRARGQSLPALASGKRIATVDDVYPESGPLAGLYAGLAAARSVCCVAVACDMPLVSASLLRLLAARSEEYDAVVPVRSGRLEPLHASYTKACLAPMRAHIEAGQLRVAAFLKDVKLYKMPEDEWRTFDPEGLSFANVNTEADLAAVGALISAQAVRRASRCHA